ncbi:sigma-54-dependent Fis family transcriptional regulator [Candidatus Woesearchaeota archaeon]|nr:sigma-54-dependent Fis family transcriptional regulator [Candidatus Woesearchaeota archaeon]
MAETASPYGVEKIIGKSPKISDLRDAILAVAPLDCTIIIYGESGVGKELVARAIYEHSNRKKGGFIGRDLRVLTPTLLETELFGAEKGAYTDAKRTREGVFATANGGILFLDEIHNAPLDVQQKLLRVLQEGTYERVGGTATLRTDVRLITATNRDLERLVREEKFDEALYYRIKVVPFQIPPLRERGEDIGLLADYYCKVYCEKYQQSLTISADGKKYLEEQNWPGNIRELMYFVEAAVIWKRINKRGNPLTLDREDFIRVADLYNFTPKAKIPHNAMGIPNVAGTDSDITILPLAVAEQRYIKAALDLCGGNISKAADKLGIARNTLKGKLNASRVSASHQDNKYP